jgi:hypothetical protein
MHKTEYSITLRVSARSFVQKHLVPKQWVHFASGTSHTHALRLQFSVVIDKPGEIG